MLGEYDKCKKCNARGIYDAEGICDECKKEMEEIK